MNRAEMWTADTGDNALLCVGRWYEGEKLLAVFNFSEQDKVAYLPENDGNYRDLITGQIMTPAAVPLAGYGFRWMKKL